MDIRKHVGGKWLNAKHIDPEADTTVTIVAARLDTVEDDDTGQVEELAGIAFEEFPRKLLGLNVINAETLEDLYGWETDDWIGQRITLYVDPDVRFGGKRVGGIRIRPRKPAAGRRVKKAPKGGPRGDQDGKRTAKQSRRRANRGDGD